MSQMQVERTRVDGNSAVISGGGINVFKAILRLVNTTVSRNIAGTKGGKYPFPSLSTCRFTFMLCTSVLTVICIDTVLCRRDRRD
jgi:hypothetical protein